MNTKKQNHISGLDGLRALAVMMVIGYHLKLPIFKGGVLGVTMFFVISGFLITRLLLKEIDQTHSIDLKNFWIKRIKRIWPALLFMVSIIVIVFAIFNRLLFTKACQDYFSVIFGFNNWYQIFNNISYFDNGGAASPLLHCWSLAIETQFYLIFPIILLLLSKVNKNKTKRYRLFILSTTILTIISSLLMFFLFDPNIDPSRVYYGLDTRAFSLLIGALLAMFVQYFQQIRLNKVFNDFIGIISLVAFCLMVSNIAGYHEILYRGGYVVASLLSAFIILSILKRNSILSKILSIPVIDWIGKLSYSLYLWHYPVIILISGGKQSSVGIMVIEIILTIVMSIISYYLIETPIRHGAISRVWQAIVSKMKNKQKNLKKDISVVLTSLLLFITSLSCVAFFPKENMSDNIKTTEEKEVVQKETEKTEVKQTVSDDDIINNLDILIIGDSVAEGAQSQLQATFPKGRINAKVSRHCSDSIPVLQSEMNDANWDGDCLIFSLGTNGPMYDFMGKTRDILKADKPMFVLTIRAPYEEWTQDNNVQIKEFCQNHDNVYLIDWASYSEGYDDWFVRDETHLTNAGIVGFTNCIKENVLKVFKEKTN